MIARRYLQYAAVGVLLLGCFAGCGNGHTTFTPGDPVEVRVAPASLTISVGDTRSLTAAAYDNKGMVVPDAAFTWNVFNPAVATVDAGGRVTALAPGVTSVSVVHNGLIARINLTVISGPVELSFDRDIKSTAALGCSCHQTGGSMERTGSMADLQNLLDKGYVVSGHPQESPYLIKGSGGANHAGGNLWGANQQQVSDWIQQGAKP